MCFISAYAAVPLGASPPGSYNDGSGSSKACEAGTYSPSAGASACIKCAAGSSSPSAATSCAQCPLGSASASGTECVECPPGSYAAKKGSALCMFCPARTASAVVGATAKSQCIVCKNQPKFGFTPAGSSVCY